MPQRIVGFGKLLANRNSEGGGDGVVNEVDEVVIELIVGARWRLLDDVEEAGSIPCERTQFGGSTLSWQLCLAMFIYGPARARIHDRVSYIKHYRKKAFIPRLFYVPLGRGS
jgi:hypothetical protein